jgi:hypothetical protein
LIPIEFQSDGSSHILFAIHMDSVALAHSDQSGKVQADQTIAQPSGFENN